MAHCFCSFTVDLIREIWGKLYNQYKNANSARNVAHGQTGEAYQPDIDVITLEALGFLHNYVENRPVHSTLVTKSPAPTPRAMAEIRKSQELELERSIHQRPNSAPSHRVWVNPASQQRKLQPYLQQLPPTVPISDAFALRKHEQGNALFNELTEIGNSINFLGGAMLQRQKEKSLMIDDQLPIIRRLLSAEIKKMKEDDLFEFYREVASEFKHNK